MDDASLEQRVVDLEIRLAHQERLGEELSDVVAAQGRLVERLRAELARLGDRTGALEAGWGRSPQDDKPPPHY